MEAYTIEDIETIRKKSGLTYQEAVALLDYHNGSLARALIDLEKNGRLKEDNAPEGKEQYGKPQGIPGKSTESAPEPLPLQDQDSER